MENLIICAAVALAVALLICMVTTDIENADRAAHRKAAAPAEFDTAARAALNRAAYARLGASANR